MRLSPDVFAELTEALRADLRRRGCTIPQVRTGMRDNVIHGYFTKPNQTDTAVLCSREHVSSILVFRNDSISDVADFAPVPDENFMMPRSIFSSVPAP